MWVKANWSVASTAQKRRSTGRIATAVLPLLLLLLLPSLSLCSHIFFPFLDDDDPSTYPGAEESCEEAIDRNCDGSVGEGDDDGDGISSCDDCDDSDPSSGYPTDFYPDVDRDGFGDEGLVESACEAPLGYVSLVGDCNDSDPAVNPDATESCDGVDEDCDGETDEDAIDEATFYVDADGDGQQRASDHDTVECSGFHQQ